MKAETLERVAIAFCLSGDDEGFIQELDAALKSVLHNAPRRTPLDVYVVGDRSASCAVERSLEASGLGGSAWPLPIEIRIIDVEALIPEWRGRVLAATPRIDERHTFGAFYRLFLHEILPSHVHHVIYSDVDVVFLANVSGLWPQRDPEVMVQWGESQCTGVMLLNMALMKSHFWEMASEAVDKSSCYGDQKLMGAIQDRFPHMLGRLVPALGRSPVRRALATQGCSPGAHAADRIPALQRRGAIASVFPGRRRLGEASSRLASGQLLPRAPMAVAPLHERSLVPGAGQ